MAKIDVLDILRAKKCSPAEFNFDSLWIPPMQCYLSDQDVEYLRKIATSIKLSSKINQKYQMIDDLMRFRGFKRFSAGTNRVVYSCLEDDRFLVKIAVDKVGMQDNPMEYKNQFLLKPYVTKMFYHSPCGTVGFVERVLPIKNKAEFRQIAGDVFDILVHKILGEFVMEDVGTTYFMNWGIRAGHAPVLLDYPYLYKLDGNKLYCTKQDPITGQMCNGEIDYDIGFNHLVCNRCGKVYLASDLRDNSIDNKIIIKRGGTQMSVVIKFGDQVVGSPIQVDDVMKRPANKRRVSEGLGLVVGINDPSKGAVELATYDSKKETSNNARNCKYDFGVSVNGIDCKAVANTEEKKVEKENETPEAPAVSTDDKTSTNQVESEAPAKVDAETTETTAESSLEDKDFVTQKEEAKADAAIELGNNAETEKSPKSVEKEEDAEKETKVETKEAVTDSSINETTTPDDDKYSEYEDMAQPKIRTGKKNGPARDANGRFVSTKKKAALIDEDFDDGRPAKKRSKKSTKSNFIPAKD